MGQRASSSGRTNLNRGALQDDMYTVHADASDTSLGFEMRSLEVRKVAGQWAELHNIQQGDVLLEVNGRRVTSTTTTAELHAFFRQRPIELKFARSHQQLAVRRQSNGFLFLLMPFGRRRRQRPLPPPPRLLTNVPLTAPTAPSPPQSSIQGLALSQLQSELNAFQGNLQDFVLSSRMDSIERGPATCFVSCPGFMSTQEVADCLVQPQNPLMDTKLAPQFLVIDAASLDDRKKALAQCSIHVVLLVPWRHLDPLNGFREVDLLGHLTKSQFVDIYLSPRTPFVLNGKRTMDLLRDAALVHAVKTDGSLENSLDFAFFESLFREKASGFARAFDDGFPSALDASSLNVDAVNSSVLLTLRSWMSVVLLAVVNSSTALQLATAYCSLAEMHRGLDEETLAIEYMEKAVNAWRVNNSSEELDRKPFAMTLNNLAKLYFENGSRYRHRCEILFRESLGLLKADSAATDSLHEQGIVLMNLAHLKMDQDQLNDALELVGQAVALHEQDSPDSRDVAIDLDVLAVIQWHLGLQTEALETGGRACKLAESLLGDADPVVVEMKERWL